MNSEIAKYLNERAFRVAKQVIEPVTPNGSHAKKVFDDLSLRLARQVEHQFFHIHPEVELHAQEVCKHVQNGFTPILIEVPHGDYVSGPLTAAAADMVVKNSLLEKFYLTVASTLADGKQGASAYSFFHAWAPFLREHEVEWVPIVRDQDRDQYTTEEITGYDAIARRTIKSIFKTNTGLMLFPEGGLDAGRSYEAWLKKRAEERKRYPEREYPELPYTPNNNRVLGIQKIIDPKVIHLFIGLMRSMEKHPFVLWGLAASGGYRIASPVTKFPRIGAIGEMFKDNPRLRVDLRSARPLTCDDLLHEFAEILQVHEKPRDVADALEEHPDAFFNHVIGRKVAPLVPWYERGFYAEIAAEEMRRLQEVA